MAEWLRRWTANPMCSARVGSNPIGVVLLFYITPYFSNFRFLQDKELGELFATCGRSMTLTIMPVSIYEHIVKKVSSGLFKKMDHSVPDV